MLEAKHLITNREKRSNFMSRTANINLKFKFRVRDVEHCMISFFSNLNAWSDPRQVQRVYRRKRKQEMCLDTSPATVNDSFLAPTPGADAAKRDVIKNASPQWVYYHLALFRWYSAATAILMHTFLACSTRRRKEWSSEWCSHLWSFIGFLKESFNAVNFYSILTLILL